MSSRPPSSHVHAVVKRRVVSYIQRCDLHHVLKEKKVHGLSEIMSTNLKTAALDTTVVLVHPSTDWESLIPHSPADSPLAAG